MPTRDDLLRAARALAPTIAAAARDAELARKPDDGVIRQARDGGLFTLMSPRCYGGSELDLDTFFEVGLILGQADGSHAWNLLFYIEHVWMFTQFPEVFQKELFSDRSYVLAPAMLSPAGRAERVDGGYRLTGRWSWGTGVVHGEWTIAGAIVQTDEGIRAKFFALPAEEVTWEDTWHMDGMCATGSHDIVIADRFVPDERAVDIGEMLNARAPGSQIHAGPLYSTPMAPILSFTAALPALGQAKASVAEFARQLETRVDMSFKPQSARVDRQALLGEVDLQVRAAEALMRSVLDEVLTRRADADERARVRWTASIAHAVGMSRLAVDRLCDAGGSTAHFLDNPLQRARRDVNTMACHTVFDLFERDRCHGRALLGLPSESRWH